jgi:hypothetical protein
VPDITVTELARLTGGDRGTIRKMLEGAKIRREHESDKVPGFYESTEVLIVRDFRNADSTLKPKDALDIARRQEIELNMQVKRDERPLLSDVLDEVQAVFDDIAGIVKGSELSDDRKKDIMERLKQGRVSVEGS